MIHVPADYPTVWEAVDAAAAGDSVLVSAGTWTDTDTRPVQLGGNLTQVTSAAFLKGGISLIGESGAASTVISAAPLGGTITLVFANDTSGGIYLEGITVTGSHAYGLLALDSGSVTIQSCRFVNNVVTSGAAVESQNCPETKVFDSEISFNARSNLAYIAGFHASEFNLVEVRRCRFEGNVGRALGGGGFGSRSMIVTDCEFIGNRATAGGGMQVAPQISLLIRNNLFLRNVAMSGSGGGLTASESPGTIEFNTFAFDSCFGTGIGGGVRLSTGFSGALSNNTFYGCYCEASAGAAAAEIDGSATVVSFEENLVTGSRGAPALSLLHATVNGGCNAMWDNEEGDFGSGWVQLPSDIFLDPLFCDAPNLDFTLDAASPCAAGNTPGCPQIGAFGVGCGQVSVEATSWGKLKSLYR